MRKRAQNSNKQFLIGTAAMAFAVIAVVVIFLILSAPHINFSKEDKKHTDTYLIELSQGFVGDSAVIFLNDSLLWEGAVPTDTICLRIDRFADENTLMVSRTRDDAVNFFPLKPEGGKFVLRNIQGVISLTKRPE